MDRPVQRFTVTPEQYARLTATAQAQHVPIVGDSGTTMKFGVGVTWCYVEPTLSIQVTNVPFFLKADTMEAKISALVLETLKV